MNIPFFAVCTACPAGHQCSNAAVDPVECDAGTFQPLAMSMTCTDCPVGTKCPSAALTASIACADGWYQHETQKTVCIECASGIYQSLCSTSAAVCQ